MSHVDDGELTAFADGAYPVNDPVALRIAAHLSTCGNCRTRLEQNETLRSRASEILAFATPETVQTPSFEALQAQAATTRLRTRRTFPLAWAASIVLALGLGWFGRAAWQTAPRTAEMAAGDVATQSAAQEEAAPAPAPSMAAQPAEPEPEKMIASGRRATRARRDAADFSGAAVGAVVEGTPTVATAAAPTAPPPTAPIVADRLELAAITVTGEAGPEYITAAEAERRGLVVPRIPELPIARIGVRGGTMIVEQTLPDDKIVTLSITQVEQPAVGLLRETEQRKSIAANPARQAAAEAAAPVQIVTRGNKSIRVFADLPADSLRVLAGKFR